jgi:hypothetical protein
MTGLPDQEHLFDMPKMKKTAAELEAIAMQTLAKIKECEGLTGLTIRSIDSDQVPYNWTVSVAHNCPGRLCEVAIETVVDEMQQALELDSP